MRHLDSLLGAGLGHSALTIGAFDGVHRGHQQILEAMRAGTGPGGPELVVLTFFPHPSVVLHGRRPSFYLTSPDEKAELLGQYGADVVITHPFTLELSHYKAAQFLDLVQENMELDSLWVGPDFALGHEREGSVHFLREQSGSRDFELHVVEPIRLSGEVVSSTRVREALRSSDVAAAATYLGRPFTLVGSVESVSEAEGLTMALVSIWEERAYPGPGVYACSVEIGSSTQAGLVIPGITTGGEENLPSGLTVVLEDPPVGADSGEIRVQFLERVRREARGMPTSGDPNSMRRGLERAKELLKDWS